MISSRKQLWRAALACLAAAALLVGSATAQETTGTITGVATDQTGAILPGVTVTVKHVQTGRTTEVVSNETGRYTATLLQPGTYEITFSLSGFQPSIVRGIELHVNDRLEVNGKLGVGVSETVDVAASSQFIQPTPAVQNLMGPRQVQELPLNNRNFVQLATLVPGVSSDLSDEVGVGLTSTVSISVNGARRNAVNWLVDGVSNVDVGSNITLLSTPTLESIQEFKIVTSSYAAEWPRSGGGIVNVVTKSGTNQFSGSAYEFYRDDKLNANSFTRNSNSNPEIANNPPQLDYNNFGYTIGGPVLPWRDKAFFFWSQEWRRITRAPSSPTANVVDPAWLNDPSNSNYVPPAQRDPNALRLLEAWPAPNVPGTSTYLASAPNINNTRQEVIRLDYDVNSAWRLTGRYTHDLSETREFGGLFLGTQVTVPDIATTETDVPGDVAALQLRTVIGGNKLNEFSYQTSGNEITSQTPEGTRNLRTDYGLTIPELFTENAAARMPFVGFTGGVLSTIGANQLFTIQYRNHTFTDNFSWTVGRHSFKGGLLLTFEQKNENAANETQGRFLFGAGGGRTAFQNFLTGNADGLCGSGCTYSEAEIDVTNHLRFNRYEMYAQDTWRPFSGVTLDYGLRYSLYPPITDRDNFLTTFFPSAYNPALAPSFANATGSLIDLTTGSLTNGIIIAGQNSPYGDAIYKYDKGNVQPRVGMTYDLRGDSRTLLRSAYGIYYDQPLVGIFEQNAFTNPPFVNTVSIQNARLSNPGAGTTTTTAGVRNLIATGEDFETPRMQQWNIGVQHQVYANGVIDMSYVGSRGDNLIRPIDINYPQPADVVRLGSANLARPYQGYGSITVRETTAKSRYHGLLTSFRHIMGPAGEVTLNYTLSRNRTDSSNDRDGVDIPQNPLDLAAEYADARTDRRHVFSGHFVYELPFFRSSDSAVFKAALAGWQVAGIVNISSGPPIPRIQVDTNGFRRGNRADQVADPRAGELDYPFWFDPTAFVPPADGAFGNSARSIFRQPGRHQWDLTFSKNWRPTDSVRLQFRADLINAFNHTQPVGDSTASGLDNTCTVSVTSCTVANDTFGRILTVRSPREIQLGLKLYW